MTLTREEILAMEPGEHLDALTGRQIMTAIPDVQWWVTDGEESGIFITFDYESEAKEWLDERIERFPAWVKKEGAKIVRTEIFKPYSSKISAAWEVVEKMRQNKIYLDLRVWPHDYQVLPHQDENNKLVDRWIVQKESLPEAICKAALLAVLDL